MTNEITTLQFNSDQFGQLRVVKDDNGEPWFVARDVCAALGIATNHVKDGLDSDEVTNLPITEIGPKQGGKYPLIVSEPGFYKLVLFADAVAASDGTCLIGTFAKILQQNGINIGQNRLFAWMRENGYLGKSGSNRNIPTQRYVEMWLFRTNETPIVHADGRVTTGFTTKLTGKGQLYFMNKFKEELAAANA